MSPGEIKNGPSGEGEKKLKFEPLDPKKVEEVIKKYEAKHIKHKHGAVVFVGSGGGKSTFCRNQKPNSEGKTDFIDSDLL